MKPRTTILFGGAGAERRISVASAQHVLGSLPSAAAWFWAPNQSIHEVSVDALLEHDQPFEHDFHPATRPRWMTWEAALSSLSPDDTLLIAIHGDAGADGTLQRHLEERGLAFTASGADGARNARDKVVAKRLAHEAGLRVADALIIDAAELGAAEQKLGDLLRARGRFVLKPTTGSSSYGLRLIERSDDIEQAMTSLLATTPSSYLAEAFVKGVELTVGVIETSDGLMALPPTEIRVVQGHSFDYAAKFLGKNVRKITPATLAPPLQAQAAEVALAAHRALGLQGYSRTDMIVDAHGPVYLETNHIPGLTRVSLLPQQLAAKNISMAEFLEHQLDLARSRYSPRRNR